MTLSSFRIARAAPIAPPKIDPHPRRRRRTDTVFPPTGSEHAGGAAEKRSDYCITQ